MGKYDFDEESKRFDRNFRMMGWAIGAVWLLMVAVILYSGYLALTLEPEDIGAFFGRIVAGFNGASQ